jgi:hypothetical protein
MFTPVIKQLLLTFTDTLLLVFARCAATYPFTGSAVMTALTTDANNMVNSVSRECDDTTVLCS